MNKMNDFELNATPEQGEGNGGASTYSGPSWTWVIASLVWSSADAILSAINSTKPNGSEFDCF